MDVLYLPELWPMLPVKTLKVQQKQNHFSPARTFAPTSLQSFLLYPYHLPLPLLPRDCGVHPPMHILSRLLRLLFPVVTQREPPLRISSFPVLSWYLFFRPVIKSG